MPRNDRVNEYSSYDIDVTPLNTSKVPYTPTTARYRVDDLRSRQNTVAWTTLTPATTMTITVPGTANTIINKTREYETKVITIQVDESLSSIQTQEHEYDVVNLEFVE